MIEELSKMQHAPTHPQPLCATSPEQNSSVIENYQYIQRYQAEEEIKLHLLSSSLTYSHNKKQRKSKKCVASLQVSNPTKLQHHSGCNKSTSDPQD